MKVVCRHGHFAFYPSRIEDVARFSRYFDLQLFPENDYYTFEFLLNAPRTSLKTYSWLGLPASVNFEGRNPWEVMKQNNFVYHLEFKQIVLKNSILVTTELARSTFYYLTRTSLIQPGSRVSTGQQILSYEGDFDLDLKTLKVRSFSFE